MAWKIGDGESVNVWSDGWVIGLEGLRLKCSQVPHEMEDLKVYSLIDTERWGWSLNLVLQLITEKEAEAIDKLIFYITFRVYVHIIIELIIVDFVLFRLIMSNSA